MKKKIREITQKTREQRIRNFITNNKYLSNSKYHKNNYVSVAHWESWTAQGKCGGCIICSQNPRYQFHNKRMTHTICKEIHSGNLCGSCFEEVEKQMGVSFKKDYAP